MNRLAVTGVMVCLAVAGVSVFLGFREDHPSAPRSADASPRKKSRVRSLPVPPAAVGGFTGTLVPAPPPADRKENILRLLAAGEFLLAQAAISEWFTADPAAAAAWLEAQPSFADFQPAISQIAKDMAESGYPEEALEWAELLEQGADRDQTIFRIYATGRRYHWLSDEQIRAAPFPPKQIADLLSGAADD